MKKALQLLDLGNSVAEFDDSLQKYFIENEAFRALVNNRVDVVAGDKGTGKTALYQTLRRRYASLPELKGVELISGFNPAGNPVFQRLTKQEVMTEGQYASVWKAYILSLVGNWLLAIVGDDMSASLKKLDHLLVSTGLRSSDDKPETVFSKILNSIQSVLKPASAEAAITFSETGVPIVTPKVTFGNGKGDSPPIKEVSHEEALRLLDDCVADVGITVWIAIDRLDEAFQGFPGVEVPALRALLRTYLDLQDFQHLRLKLFVRRDLFRKVIGDGFVNLTHINARKIEIIWEEADLLNLLCRRVRERRELLDLLAANDLTDEALFYRLMPDKVDPAERKPTSWNWIMSRIRDGNNTKPPRNLIDLVTRAREAQLRAESRMPRSFTPEGPLLESLALRAGLSALSTARVEDTLLAEGGAYVAAMIEKFRRSKAEHNRDSISETLGITGATLDAAIKQLVEIGLLEELKSTWKVPMLYRDGLGITQGKAFADNAPGATQHDDED